RRQVYPSLCRHPRVSTRCSWSPSALAQRRCRGKLDAHGRHMQQNAVRNMWATRGADEAHQLLYIVTESEATTGQFAERPMPALEASSDGGKSGTETPAIGIP